MTATTPNFKRDFTAPYSEDATPDDLPPRSDGAERIWLEVRDSECDRCPLGMGGVHRVAQTVCITGDGPVPAAGALVGEGPGAVEDALERVFVGQTSAYLYSCLLDVGIDPEQVYSTNATRCVPPRENKDDRVVEAVKPCKPYLLEELKRVHPTVVLTMGNAALQSVTGMRGVLKKRGTEYFDEEIDAWVVVTVHPAAVFREPQLHEGFMADLAKFARRLHGEQPPPPPEVVTCLTVDQVAVALDELRGAKVVTFDLETQGLEHWHPHSKIWCVGLSTDPSRAFLVPLEHPESPFVVGPKLDGEAYSAALARRKRGGDEVGPRIREWLSWPWSELATPDLHRVYDLLRAFFADAQVSGHNLKFDTTWWARRNIETRVRFDTMLAAHLLNENRAMNLESLCMTELGVQGWGKRKVAFDPPDALSIMGPYCATDAAHDHALGGKLSAQLRQGSENFQNLFQRVSLPAVDVFRDAELHGIWLDRERCETRLAKARKERDKIDQQLLKHVPKTLRSQAEETIAKGKSPFGSTDFLNLWLFGAKPNGLGLSGIRRVKDKGGKPRWSTDEATLQELAPHSEAVGLMLVRRSAEKTVEFFESWLSVVDENDYVHPSFNLVGTVTGRKSSGFHTVPRESTRPGARSIFGAPEGWTFVECDFSQVELRIAAWLAEEPTMLAVFQNGGDIHTYTAGMVTGKLQKIAKKLGLEDKSIVELSAEAEFNELLEASVTKEERHRAKAINFGFLFGMGAAKFQLYALENYDQELSLPECEEFQNTYFEIYGGLGPWHEHQRQLVKKPPHEVWSPIDRIRRLPMIFSSDWDVAGKAERQAINSPVQGLAPDLVQLAVNKLVKMFSSDEARFLGEVHDSALFVVRTDVLEKWLPIIKWEMEHPNLGAFDVEIPVPLKVDVSIGEHWGETSEENAEAILREAA